MNESLQNIESLIKIREYINNMVNLNAFSNEKRKFMQKLLPFLEKKINATLETKEFLDFIEYKE
jgi:hypothetical protein